jgi:hypothetical protein
MKRQGTGNTHRSDKDPSPGTPVREQGTEDLAAMLRKAVPPFGDDVELERDLWQQMQARLGQADRVVRLKSVPWFDWALAGGVALFAVVAPASIPVLLYYL